MSTQIQLRRGLASEWTSVNPVLAEGELGLETDTSKLKIGNGSSNWSSLDYITGGSSSSASYELGQVLLAAEQPLNGTWLETGGYFSKSLYQDLATTVGDIPDISNYNENPTIKIPQFNNSVQGSLNLNPYATNGTIYVTCRNYSHAIYSTDGITWTPVVSNIPTNSIMNGVVYVNNKFILLSSKGYSVSIDGINWTYYGQQPISNIVYFNSTYYASATNISNGFPGIYKSTDLKTWTIAWSSTEGGTQIAPYTIYLYNNTLIFNTTNDIGIYKSVDGITWTKVLSVGGRNWNISYNGTTYVAASNNGLYYSTDLTNWTLASNLAASCVKYVNNLVIAGISTGFATSPDGINWTNYSNLNNNCFDFAWTGSKYYIVGANGTYFTSTDGVTWINFRDTHGDTFLGIIPAYSTVTLVGTYYNVTVEGTSNWEYLTEMGQWLDCFKLRSSGDSSSYMGTAKTIAYDGVGRYIIVSTSNSEYNPIVITSTDNGATWSGLYVGYLSTTSGIKFVNNRWYIFGQNGTVYTSTNGTTWTLCVSPGTNNFSYNDIEYNGTNYVMASSGNGLRYSADGITFTATTVTTNIYGVIWANSIFVAWGASGVIYTSTDGVTWTSRSSQISGYNIAKVIYANSLFVAVGSNGKITTSSDGITWTARTSNVSNTLHDIVYGNGIFVSVGQYSTITRSTDGINWINYSQSQDSETLINVVYGNSKFVAITYNNNYLWESINGINWYKLGSGASMVQNLWTRYGTSLVYINNTYFSFAAGEIRKSNDGFDWRPITKYSTPSPGRQFRRATKINNNYYILTNCGFYSSTDGSNFTLQNFYTGACVNIVYKSNIYYAYFAGGNKFPDSVYSSTDGINWVKLTDLFTSISNQTGGIPIYFGVSGNNLVMIKGTTYTGTGQSSLIYYSTDGITWNPSTYSKLTYLSYPPLNANGKLILPYNQYVYISNDNGQTWNEILKTPGINNVYVVNNGTTYYLISNGRIFVSEDLVSFIPIATYNISSVYGYFYVSGWTIITTNIGFYALKDKNVFPLPANKMASGYGYMQYNIEIIDGKLYLGTGSNYSDDYQWLVQEIQPYSYNTSTTFYIPLTTTGSNEVAYVYAGA